MDATMTTVNKSNDESNVKANDEEQIHQRATRSASHGRPPSASGIRSKIPMNINHSRPTSSAANAQITPCTQDDSSNSIMPGNATRRLTRSHNSALSNSKGHVIASGGMQKRCLETQFKREKKRYLTMKKEIDEKQKSAQHVYDIMTQLREKLMADGGTDPGKVDEIRIIFDQTNKQSGDQNKCRGSGELCFVINSTINEEFISKIENELKNYPQDCPIICENVLKNHSEILKWMENFGKSNEKFSKEINQQVDKYTKDMEISNVQLDNGKKLLDEFNMTLVKKIMIMWSEIDALRIRIKHLESMSGDTVNELRVKVNAETEKFNQLKEKKATVDNELTKSKARIHALETRIDTDETKITQLQSHLKNLESQLKQKDVNFEHSTRDLHKSLKHSEETIVNLETQKDNLETRLKEMKDKMEREKKRRMDKSPRVHEMTKRSTEDDIESDKETKKKVGELETLVEVLREEVAVNKKLIVKLQNEKSTSEIQLKDQLANEQARATRLMENYEQLKKEHETMQQKTKTRDTQMLALCYNDYDAKNTNTELGSIELVQLTENLRQEIAELKRKNKELEAQLQQQMKNLEIKNQMITYLKENPDMNQMDKETDSKTEVLKEVYSTLETKQMQLTHLENVLKQMEDQEMRNQEQRTRYERRIAQLEYDAQMRKSKDSRYVLDFSDPQSSSKQQNELAKVLELERKYQRLKRESWQMGYIYNKIMEPTIKSVRSHDYEQHSHGSYRDREYACRAYAEPSYADVDCYVHQGVDNCSRESGCRENPNSRYKVRCWSRSSQRMKRKMPSKAEPISRIHK
ncbi:hypothetical protein PV328_003470 [Microctonus aethiopoides]|uniref:Uncharacterized protein n=1 Tax=Microctonus aethiopoides TaxID=144406 RepID=A0AA39KKJ2_9HYME|nr:hypothetical protein PV328_003470 [Microctonus aethiopoides]